MSIFESAIAILAPSECIICSAEGPGLCELCQQAEVLPYGERCGFCGRLSDDGRTCPACRRQSSPRHVWISTDYSGAAQVVLKAYKFGHNRSLADSIARIMCANFDFYNSPPTPRYLVVPIPTASSRRRRRGFDHAQLLAHNSAIRLGLESRQVLGRLGQSRQVGTKRAERQAQAAGSYFVRRLETIKGKNILLIDDVITTGATLRAATKALRQAGAKQVDALIFAKRL